MIRLNLLSQSNLNLLDVLPPPGSISPVKNTIKRRETICVHNLRKKLPRIFFTPKISCHVFPDFYPITAFLLSSLMIQTVCLFFTPKKLFVEHWSCFKEQALLRSAIYSNRYFFTFFVFLLQACTTRGPRKLLTWPANPQI